MLQWIKGAGRAALYFWLLTFWFLTSPAPARAVIDLLGATEVTFEWDPPTTGYVVGYRVYASFNGGARETVHVVYENRAKLGGDPGDTLELRVAAFNFVYGEGPRSEVSEAIRFAAAPPAAPPEDASGPPPTDPGDDTPPDPADPDPNTPPPPPLAQPRLDFDGDGHSDILLRHAVTGELRAWTLDSLGVRSELLMPTLPLGWRVVGNGDFDGNGHADLLTRDEATGQLTITLLERGLPIGGGLVGVPLSDGWIVAGSSDHDGDGRADLLLRNALAGVVGIWWLDGARRLGQTYLADHGANWEIVATGDYDGNGLADILWENGEGLDVLAWLLDDSAGVTEVPIRSGARADRRVVGSGDQDGDGRDEILLRRPTDGRLESWFVTTLDPDLADNVSSEVIGRPTGATFEVMARGDYNGDGLCDLTLRGSEDGRIFAWFVHGVTVIRMLPLGLPAADWHPVGIGAESPLTHRWPPPPPPD